MRLFWTTNAAGSAIFFIVIGLLLATQKQLGIDGSVISGTVIVLLYIKGPVEQIAGALPALDQARVSFRRVAALSLELDQHEPNLRIAPSDRKADANKSITRTEPRGVTYAFPAPDGAAADVAFQAPPNIAVRPTPAARARNDRSDICGPQHVQPWPPGISAFLIIPSRYAAPVDRALLRRSALGELRHHANRIAAMDGFEIVGAKA